MCLAIPGKVKSLKERKAVIEYPGQIREAFLSDVAVSVGDYVMVQMGVVVNKLDKQSAKEMYTGWGFSLE